MTVSLEELLLDDEFRQWVFQPNDELNQQWNERLASASPEEREVIQQGRAVLQSLPPEATLSDAEVTMLWTAIQRQQPALDEPDTVPVRQLGWRSGWYRIAAVLALVSVLGWLGWRTYSERTIAVQTRYGQQQQITLPDGSLVTLNGNSTLSYPANWSQLPQREVTLDGEAYFRVSKQRVNNRPVKFTVHSGNLNIDVVGTQFNVRNRHDKVDVVLDEGHIQISQQSRGGVQDQLVMKPGEIVVFSKKENALRRQRVNRSTDYSSWTKNVLIFNETPLSEIAETMRDTYGLQVSFTSDSLAQLGFTGNIPAQSPEQVLATLAKAFDLQTIRTDSDKVLFKPN